MQDAERGDSVDGAKMGLGLIGPGDLLDHNYLSDP
jgi:hypothetical protein